MDGHRSSTMSAHEGEEAAETNTQVNVAQGASTGHTQGHEQRAGDRKSDPHDESTASMSSLPPLPQDSTLLSASSEMGENDGNYDSPYQPRHNQTVLEEREMRRKLMDIESSFLPEPSTISVGVAGQAQPGVDDTYLVGVPLPPREEHIADDSRGQASLPQAGQGEGQLRTGQTPEDTSGGRTFDDSNVSFDAHEEGNTSALETLGSSPTAAAAARTVSRVLSTASRNSDKNQGLRALTPQSGNTSRQYDLDADVEPTARKLRRQPSPSLRGKAQSTNVDVGEDNSRISDTGSERRRRPRYLTSRQSTHRASIDSVNSANTDATPSDATLGADYALQSGGAVPGNPSGRRREDLSRTVSLGSMASGISNLSDERQTDRRNFSVSTTDGGLHTLDEEPSTSRSGSPTKRTVTANQEDAANDPVTPKAKSRDRDPSYPTDTVIAQHVRDIQVPGTFARQFRENYGPPSYSPDKRPGAPTPGFGRSGKNLTLKEQSHHIDRLSKENFDLKMRIHFLNEALNKRSEEGIKEMISENVELKSDKLRLQKEIQGLKRTIRDLEKQLKDRDQSGGAKDPNASQAELGESDDEARNNAAEEEILFLRERVETYEVEIDRLRSESLVRETEKRKLAEMVKSLGDGRAAAAGSDAGAREERDMWKDMLDAETAAREQAEDENKKLRDEILRMKTGARKTSLASHSTFSERDPQRKVGTSSTISSTLVELELLKQENAELRREVSAQTSMLTSRNREKERLYQEIEDLKLQRRDRSAAGDSIFERSASRALVRSPSRASDGTRDSRISDAERENLETRNGELRDQVSALKMESQALRGQLDERTAEYEALDRDYQRDVDQLYDELHLVEQDRDQALVLAEEREGALQDLQAEAQQEIDALEEQLEMKMDECERLEVELRNQEENLKVLQAEMRSASEGIIRLEEDAQANLRKYKAVQEELDDANKEIETLEKDLFEANSTVQRLTVQIESSQNEISFLREEQDGDKLRISDLESELKTLQVNLHSEKEKTRDLEARIAEERHQREVVAGKEKQEVQRIMNELNREASTAKDEVRKLRKSLSARDVEATTWKERFTELESGLREALGDLNGNRSSLLTSITKLQKELESTTLELESTRTKLDEKESLLRNRDSLLESHGLESRKLADLLERERQARRADKHSFESALKTQQQASRTISQNHSRISDLENARSQDRKRLANLEQQYKDQLSERNALFLALWKRLSTLCGPDWAHSNSLINGNLPSLEVIGNILFWPGFSRNLLLAVKTVENMVLGFRTRIKSVERDLTKEYQNLEHNLSIRIKKLDRLEDTVRNMLSQHHRSTSNSSPTGAELTKLRGENRMLRAELNLIQSHPQRRHREPATAAAVAATTRNLEQDASPNSPGQAALVRQGSTSSGGHDAATSGSHSRSGSLVQRNLSGSTLGGDANQDRRWIERLRELERRLKAEREARLLDRSGARKRLEERDAENEELRAALERERLKHTTSASERSRSRSRKQHEYDTGTETHSSDEVEGITVDIEY